MINSKGNAWNVSCILPCPSSIIALLHHFTRLQYVRNDACRDGIGVTHVIYSRRLHFGESSRARALRVDN